MTTSEFNLAVRKWARKVKNSANLIVEKETHSSGQLAGSIRFHQRFFKGVTERVGFEFAKHGVFVQYGAGRGYVVKNGVLMRGFRATKPQIEILLKRGYAKKDAEAMKYAMEGGRIKRKPVDWVNAPIKKNIQKLADICGEYYGDKTLEYVLQNYDHLLIGKRNG